MIGALRGQVAALGEDAALIDVGGVGYLVHCGSRTLGKLETGAAARLAIETHVREDAIRLYGFLSEDERAWFVHLQSVPSVGARVALNILDALSPGEIADAVSLGDKASFARANGVGPKLAARLAQELAGKAPPRGFGTPALEPNAGKSAAPAEPLARNDAVSALVNLGIDQSAAARAVATAIRKAGGELDTPALIRAALREVQT